MHPYDPDGRNITQAQFFAIPLGTQVVNRGVRLRNIACLDVPCHGSRLAAIQSLSIFARYSKKDVVFDRTPVWKTVLPFAYFARTAAISKPGMASRANLANEMT
jgi:hypothetical protein